MYKHKPTLSISCCKITVYKVYIFFDISYDCLGTLSFVDLSRSGVGLFNCAVGWSEVIL